MGCSHRLTSLTGRCSYLGESAISSLGPYFWLAVNCFEYCFARFARYYWWSWTRRWVNSLRNFQWTSCSCQKRFFWSFGRRSWLLWRCRGIVCRGSSWGRFQQRDRIVDGRFRLVSFLRVWGRAGNCSRRRSLHLRLTSYQRFHHNPKLYSHELLWSRKL